MIGDDGKMHVLKQHVDGPAREAISGLCSLHTLAAYQKARIILKERFGSEFTVANEFRKKINAWPKMKPHEHKQIQSFSDFLTHCEIAATDIKELEILNDCEKNLELMSKLPDNMINRWKREVTTHRKNHRSYPSFSQFVKFVQTEAEILNDPITSSLSGSRVIDSHKPQKHNNKALALLLA
ncbi:hypothetical protein EB796_018528 [Bugula neritina]|uniref:Uncharacterized protein n=1 Tax=Bugula neritina TaxID=10212 RepID=A0A7J7JC21_BUGNE|nr:hypothetical protein EB796_018528 [Bugula neritina]